MDSTANQSLEHESQHQEGRQQGNEHAIPIAFSSTSHRRAASLPFPTASTAADEDRIYRYLITFHLKSNGSTISKHGPIIVNDVPCIIVKRFEEPGRTFRDIANKITACTGWKNQETIIEEDRVYNSTWVIQFMCPTVMDGRGRMYLMGELRMSVVGEYTRKEALEKLWVEVEQDGSVERGEEGESTGGAVGRRPRLDDGIEDSVVCEDHHGRGAGEYVGAG
ncbi:hypothetical protein DPSP01_000925 [Paraphaeosphaeria sporulosa]|uniref:Uncharacterized protein n=1 Tax=Paraphaeosphaeria sporulosa TaxID=1460663 RepID=A0A177CPA1_9PLEO|nr:uncharacterized protein CC84DRAFT_1234762 [Paraphaeosphaeria sporulosa]OAG09344.1 hypothetical protein CC84DRAFT_1234762 [Paraphaeosphaeria sporulosa]